MDKQKDFSNSIKVNDRIRTGFIKSYGYTVYINVIDVSWSREMLERTINHYLLRFKFQVFITESLVDVWEIRCMDPYSVEKGGWKTMAQFWQIINMTNVCISLLNERES